MVSVALWCPDCGAKNVLSPPPQGQWLCARCGARWVRGSSAPPPAARLLHTYPQLVQAAEWSLTALLLLHRSRLLGVLLHRGCELGAAWLAFGLGAAMMQLLQAARPVACQGHPGDTPCQRLPGLLRVHAWHRLCT